MNNYTRQLVKTGGLILFASAILVAGPPSAVGQTVARHDWIRLGMELTSNGNPTVRKYGWNAVQKGLSLSNDASQVDSQTIQHIVNRAADDSSPSAINTLISLYSTRPDLRREAMLNPDVVSPARRATVQSAAALAAIGARNQRSSIAANTDAAQLLQSDPGALLNALLTCDPPQIEDLVNASLPGLLEDQRQISTIIATYLASSPLVLDASDVRRQSRLRLLESLARKLASNNDQNDPVRLSAMRATRELSNDQQGTISLQRVLLGLTVSPVQIPDPAPNRAPVVQLLESSLLYKVPSINVNEAAAGVTVANVTLDLNSLTTPETYFVRDPLFSSRSARVSLRTYYYVDGQPMTCASAHAERTRTLSRLDLSLYGPDFGAPRYIGACVAPLVRITSVTDTPSAIISSLGAAHRIWGKSVPGHFQNIDRTIVRDWRYVVTGGVTARIRVGYTPDANTNLIAWRPHFQSAIVTPVQPVSGLLFRDAIAIEPGTNWRFFAVSPHQRVEFTFDVTPAPAIWLNDFLEDLIDILEVNVDNTPQSGLRTPLEIARLPSDLTSPPSGNAVVRFASALQESLQEGGWLAPVGHESVVDATIALARFAQLSELSRLPLDSVQLPEQQRLLFQQRQLLLKSALPLIAYRIFARYGPKIETEIGLMTGTLPRIESIRTDLLHAVEQIDELTAEQARLRLAAADRLGSPASNDLVNERLEALLAAVVGASRSVDELAATHIQRLQMRCDLLQHFTAPSFEGLPMKPQQESLDACSDLRSRP